MHINENIFSSSFVQDCTQSILKCKFPSVHKPLQKQAPQKGPLKNVRPGAYFQNFTVFLILQPACCNIALSCFSKFNVYRTLYLIIYDVVNSTFWVYLSFISTQLFVSKCHFNYLKLSNTENKWNHGD